MTYTIKSFIQNPDELLEYLKQFKLTNATRSSYAPDRKEIWVNLGSNLQSMRPDRQNKIRHKILTPGSGLVIQTPERLQILGDRLLPGWNSGLITNNGGIAWHRDHGIFQNEAVLINLGSNTEFSIAKNRDATFNDMSCPANYETIHLKHGNIIYFDTKYLHKSNPENKEERYCLIFFRLRPGWQDYLPKCLTESDE